jgi:hypothetical protein
MEEAVTDPYSGEETVQIVNVPQSALEQLQAAVKIDVTPKGVYDRFAREQSLENFLTGGFFSPQRIGELKAYVKALPDDAVAPKMLLEKVIEDHEEQMRRIAMIDAQAQLLQQRAHQFIMGDPDEQADMMADAQMQLQGEEEVEEAEEEMEEPEE